jgi:hypothetical protein
MSKVKEKETKNIEICKGTVPSYKENLSKQQQTSQ